MKSLFTLFSASAAVLALAACSPSTPASDASASVSETAAATVAADATVADTADTIVTESEASSAAAVVVTQAETYDPVVIKQIGQKPGYWEVKHTDPKTKKSYITHVCVDKALGDRMSKSGPIPAPSDRRDYKDDASFKGECPTGIRGGDVQKSDGKKINAYGDRKPQAHGPDNKAVGGDRPNGQNSNGQKDQPGSNTPEPSHNPHTTPAEDHANDKPMNDKSPHGTGSSSARPDQDRG